MKREYSISVEEAIGDITPTKAPEGVPQIRWSSGMPTGRKEGKEVAWRRGHQAGIHSAYLTIRGKYPDAANELLKAFSMKTNGNIVM